MAGERRFFYGWILLPIVWLIYGLGISPAYVSWGQFAPRMIEDLGIDRGDIGGVFGLFTFLYSAVGPIVGILQGFLGIRWTMTIGLVMSAAGFYVMSQAETLLACYLGFGVLVGAGVGLATIIPCQTIGQNWFLKYRARAIAFIFTAGGLFNAIVPQLDRYILNHHTWRDGWLWMMGIALVMAVVTAVFVRNKPEDMGQHRDGVGADASILPVSTPSRPVSDDSWTAWQACLTPQFVLITLAGVAYALPWGVVFSHGKLHLVDLGYEQAMVAGVFSTMALISIAGRLSGALGDFVSPQLVLAVSLVMEGVGTLGFFYAETAMIAYGSAILVGLGFGAAYISIPVVFTAFFGRTAFATTSGWRMLITGIFNGLAPKISGEVYDATGSYQYAFIGLFVLAMIGAVAAFVVKHPGDSPTTRNNGGTSLEHA